MFSDWQLLTSLGITAIAGVYLGWRLWGSASGAGPVGCPSCARCPAKSGVVRARRAGSLGRRLPLVELEIE